MRKKTKHSPAKISYVKKTSSKIFQIKEDKEKYLSCNIKSFGQTRFDGWSNLLFFGDNLTVLKMLLNNPDIAGKVKLIYIDPPFGTNQDFKGGISRTVSKSREDETAYNDRLVGATYIEFLRKRIILLREILAEDGSIYVHIDWKMCHYVKVMMDEIFGHTGTNDWGKL